MFIKKCKYIRKKVVRHINNNLSDFSSYDEFDESDEKEIKAMRLIFLEKAILKMFFFLREQF